MAKIYDCHNHTWAGACDSPAEFQKKAKSAGIDGGSVFSLPPAQPIFYRGFTAPHWKERIDRVIEYCSQLQDYYPGFWVNPTEKDAPEQIEYAKKSGIRLLKVLCSSYGPADGMNAFRKAAEVGLPVLFHSGILWDGMASSGYNRPLAFECLLDLRGFRFALAHVSWPWTDECIAMYGKFQDAFKRRGKEDCAEMFIDVSPGAPTVYRANMFRNMLFTNYNDMNRHVMFGVDSSVNDFGVEWARKALNNDCALLERLQKHYEDPELLELDGSAQFMDGSKPDFHTLRVNMTETNYLRFIGEIND